MGKKHKSSLSKQFILKLMDISLNRMHIGMIILCLYNMVHTQHNIPLYIATYRIVI